jgi:hypothetical protein
VGVACGGGRRVLQLALAFIWLLDGVLQYQPFMFTNGFSQMLCGTAAGNPVERFPQVNLSTVHRTVATLVEYGAVHPLAWPGEARYGLSTQPHVHAVCEVCGSMSEIPAARLAPAVAEAGRASGLDLPEDGLALFGRCSSCRSLESQRGAEAGSAGSR